MAEKLDLDALKRALIGSAMGLTFRECHALIDYAQSLEAQNLELCGIAQAADAQRRALESASQPGGGDWQPIETAPKDGTEILLCRESRVTSGVWLDWSHKEPEYHATTGEYLGHYEQDSGAGWMSLDGGFTEGEPPTHWMPLPAAPSGARRLSGAAGQGQDWLAMHL